MVVTHNHGRSRKSNQNKYRLKCSTQNKLQVDKTKCKKLEKQLMRVLHTALYTPVDKLLYSTAIDSNGWTLF